MDFYRFFNRDSEVVKLFGTGKNIVVYFPVIASADNQLWMKNSKVPYLKDG